jgi:hypothetical protein
MNYERYKDALDEACMNHDIAYSKAMDLSGLPQAWAIYQADRVLLDAAAKIPNTDLDPDGWDYRDRVIVAFKLKLIADFLDVLERAAIWLPVNAFYLLARGWRWPRCDPLALDLDNDGIETVGISAGILFDHNADGLKTGTGWLKPDDGFLVLDRNGNGTIDSGRELFGVDTLLTAGITAADGFTALADLDTNSDHVFNSSDAQFANVRVWRDLNQDGVSQAGELFTLASLGITAIDLAAHTATKTLAGGNTQTLAADVAGLEGPAVNLNLDQNPFYSQFTDSIPLTPQTQTLPDMQGAGAVRSLREAATLSPALATKLATLQSTYLTRDQFKAQLGSVLTLWANTSGLQSSVDWGPGYYMSKEQVCLGMGTINVTTLMTPADRAIQAAQDIKRPQLLNEISVLERFNGLTFITRNTDGTFLLGNGTKDPIMATSGTTDGGLGVMVSVPIILADQQVTLLDQAYQALVDSVYDALALQTRLKPYVDAVGLNITDTGIAMDFTAVGAGNDKAWRMTA